MDRSPPVSEQPLGLLIVEGQRQNVLVRSEADAEGTWHNALVFRRDGKLSPSGDVVAGLEWHLPPGRALEEARRLSEAERVELFRTASAPRRPL